MKITKLAILLAFLSSGVFSGSCLGQQSKVFNWLPPTTKACGWTSELSHGADLSHVRKRRKYSGGYQGRKADHDILDARGEWKEAPQHPEAIANLRHCACENTLWKRGLCVSFRQSR